MAVGRKRSRPDEEERVGKVRLEDWLPSSPRRNPTHVLRVDFEGRLLIVNYCGVFAAKKAFDHIVSEEEYKWLDSKTIQTESGLKVRSDQLEEIVEYDFSKEQQEWDFPEEERRKFYAIRSRPEDREQARKERNERLGVDQDDKPERTKKERTPRASREGLVTVQMIAEEFGIEPREARGILRKAKVEKPSAGWAGNETWADNIRKIIEKGMKK
jgi:hypothetical protein